MVNTKNITPLGEPADDGSFSSIQPQFEQCYASLMDSSFAALGRPVVLHLTPEQTVDVSGIEAFNVATRYNPFMGRAARATPSTVSTTRTTGTQLVHRNVTYTAHIKHGPKDIDESTGVALSTDQVQLTTIIASLAHLDEAQSATIDGLRYKLDSFRQIGFQNVRYVMSFWTRINEQENAT